MNKNYYYKLKDIENEEYSIYIRTNKECAELLEKAVEMQREEDYAYYLDVYIQVLLKRADIEFEKLNFKVIEW